jgi:type III restriction enzyme
MDAIQPGIVKVPRAPVDDDAKDPRSTYLRLWDFVGTKLPGRATKGKVKDWTPPGLEVALLSLRPTRQVVISEQSTIKASSGDGWGRAGPWACS